PSQISRAMREMRQDGGEARATGRPAGEAIFLPARWSAAPSPLREAHEILRLDTAHLLLPVPAAKRDVFLLPADFDLRALLDHLSVGAEAHDHRGLAAASADGAHLAQLVGDRQKRARAGKQLALEIGAQSVAHDRHVKPVGDPGELPDL